MSFKLFFAVLLLSVTALTSVQAQRYVFRDGVAIASSKTADDDISAENRLVVGAIDLGNNTLAFSMMIKSFRFTKPLTQEPFKTDFLHTEQFPTIDFDGSYIGKVDLTKDDTYPVNITGDLSLHGVKRQVKTPALLIVKNKQLSLSAFFMVPLDDYKISVPQEDKNRVGKVVNLEAKFNFQPAGNPGESK